MNKMTLKSARVNKGYSQEEAAKILGVSKETLGNWERGKTYPDIPNLKKLERLYDVEYRNMYFF